VEQDNFKDPIVPALDIPREGLTPRPSDVDKTGEEAGRSLSDILHRANTAAHKSKELDISDDRVEIPQLKVEDLPQCPKCGTGLLRPGVVWFGEMLPESTIDAVDNFIEESEKIDLILVIGTSAKVYPAAAYVDRARTKGARVAVVNMDRADTPGGRNGLAKGDWFFEGDAGVILPQILRSTIEAK
jgi:NAD-dependent SIR2 family protein deacetylase